jgi:hypothetical protein
MAVALICKKKGMNGAAQSFSVVGWRSRVRARLPPLT